MYLIKQWLYRYLSIWWIPVLCYLSFSCSERTKIACAGDSITYGYGLENQDNNSYPSLLNKKFGNAVKVKNFGHSGATALKNSDLPYWNVSEFSKLKKYQPDIIILLLGTNDAKEYNWPGREKFLMDYESLVLELTSLKSNPKMYLGMPPPVFGEQTTIINKDTIINEIIPAIKTIASDFNLQVIDFYSEFEFKSHMFPDNIHPNTDGTTRMADIVYHSLIDDLNHDK